jgi:hypothetical protein
VFQEYELEDGSFFPKGDSDWLDENRAEDENLFLSFVGLGARGNPSEKTILDWVRRYGLLWRKNARPEDDRMSIEDFRGEVRCARQMLILYEAVQTRDPSVLERLFADSATSSWQYIPSTVIDRLSQYYDLRGPDSSLMNAWNLLREAMQEKLQDGVSPTFMNPPGDVLGFRQGWYCRDLHSAIYLSFYLFVTHGRPVRECERCQKPMVVTRSDKKYCSVNCRVNANNARDRQSLVPTLQR